MATNVQLCFMFSTNPNLKMPYETTTNATAADLKEYLLANWPKEMESADLDRLRLICMGQMLSDNSRTLQEYKVRVLDSNPTPVTVSVRPSGMKASPVKKVPGNKTAAGATTGAPANRRQEAACCVIS
mmetsp:Transcript_34673/g.78394  ORF Transcript_34673/g.78394 Transcript_34673/m.78394 type:complete len:128 (+) Transcript_34673:90-473(+)